MSTIKSSRYITPIRQLVDEWDKRLTLLSKTIDEWITCQRRWLYLEQIFSTPDIQLTQETKIFVQVDKTWKELMRRTEQQPNALKAATQPGTLELLQTNNAQMEKIQRALEVSRTEEKGSNGPIHCILRIIWKRNDWPFLGSSSSAMKIS
jgi:hypothetical protein